MPVTPSAPSTRLASVMSPCNRARRTALPCNAAALSQSAARAAPVACRLGAARRLRQPRHRAQRVEPPVADLAAGVEGIEPAAGRGQQRRRRGAVADRLPRRTPGHEAQQQRPRRLVKPQEWLRPEPRRAAEDPPGLPMRPDDAAEPRQIGVRNPLQHRVPHPPDLRAQQRHRGGRGAGAQRLPGVSGQLGDHHAGHRGQNCRGAQCRGVFAPAFPRAKERA